MVLQAPIHFAFTQPSPLHSLKCAIARSAMSVLNFAFSSPAVRLNAASCAQNQHSLNVSHAYSLTKNLLSPISVQMS